ncbi:hypothetical protein KR038_009605 [Drosophila bunnanda]|nr:hypothetical protein KR038_009605 [Drosophila bunnanda]
MGRNNSSRDGVSAQTSLGVADPTGHAFAMTLAGCNATAQATSQCQLTDGDVMSEEAIKNPGTSSLRREGPRRSSEGMKAKAQYKAALKIRARLEHRVRLSQEDKEALAWADKRIEESRLHFAQIPNMASTCGFANKVEEMFANKRHRPADNDEPVREPRDVCPSPIASGPVCMRQHGPEETDLPPIASGPVSKLQRGPEKADLPPIASEPVSKRQRGPEEADLSPTASGPVSNRQCRPKEADPPPIATKPNRKAETKESQMLKRNLIVALIDRSDENGQMTEARWKIVHAQLVKSLFASMEADPNAPMPTFDGAGWLNGVKMLKCMDVPTLNWLTQTVCKMEALWKGAKLEVVQRELIPSKPKAKVLFPVAVQGDHALKLLQRQNPDIPTADWKILHLANPLPRDGGQSAVLQINKEAEDILYPKNGKMAWGMGCVYLRLRKRHRGDTDAHTLQAGEVEKDLGVNNTLTLNESDEEDDDLTFAMEQGSVDTTLVQEPWNVSSNVVASKNCEPTTYNRTAEPVRNGLNANFTTHYSSGDAKWREEAPHGSSFQYGGRHTSFAERTNEHGRKQPLPEYRPEKFSSPPEKLYFRRPSP